MIGEILLFFIVFALVFGSIFYIIKYAFPSPWQTLANIIIAILAIIVLLGQFGVLGNDYPLKFHGF